MDLINNDINTLVEKTNISNKEHIANFLQVLEYFPKIMGNTQQSVTQLSMVLSTFEQFIEQNSVEFDMSKKIFRIFETNSW